MLRDNYKEEHRIGDLVCSAISAKEHFYGTIIKIDLDGLDDPHITLYEVAWADGMVETYYARTIKLMKDMLFYYLDNYELIQHTQDR